MNKTEALGRLKAYGTAQNRKIFARHGMTGKVYGVSYAKLEKKAIAAANRIGKVEVDHGETGCKTPDAVTYIPKAAAHARKKAAKKRAK